MGGLFYRASSTMQSRASVFGRWQWFRRREQRQSAHLFQSGLADRLVQCLTCLRPDTRALVLKDFRMFWRDTTQWAQTLVLFGLLAVYIFNLRHFTQQLSSPFWVHLVAYLNLGACSLNLATLTTRFVFPQFSLEGKRLWIVGMSPMGIRNVMRVKFWLAAVTAECVTLTLIFLSCHMLKMAWPKTLFFVAAVTVMTFTLTGLAVGLGALYPNFKEENPSKIVSGFGGTFCLVLSFIYILGGVMLLALASPWDGVQEFPAARAFLCLTGFAALSFCLGWIPFKLGLNQLKTFEL
jgi:ABC-2 type transport system permease protein